MAKLKVKNKAAVTRDIGVAISRLRDTRVALYRQIVWDIFMEVTREAPQFSGSLVAHFFLGIDKDEAYFNPTWGRQDLRLMRTLSGERKPLEKGNRYWMEFARQREKPKLKRIRRDSRVIISNGALGDTDNGRSSESYADDLQDPSYWSQKLRDVNKPYVVTYESAMAIAHRYQGLKIDPFDWKPLSVVEL